MLRHNKATYIENEVDDAKEEYKMRIRVMDGIWYVLIALDIVLYLYWLSVMIWLQSSTFGLAHEINDRLSLIILVFHTVNTLALLSIKFEAGGRFTILLIMGFAIALGTDLWSLLELTLHDLRVNYTVWVILESLAIWSTTMSGISIIWFIISYAFYVNRPQTNKKVRA